MKQVNATFLNLAAQTPSTEIGLSISEKIQKESNAKQIFYLCNGAFKSCSINILNKKSICKLCYEKALIATTEYKKYNEVQIISFTEKDLSIYRDNTIEKSCIDEIVLGVNSTIASQFRITDINQLSHKWLKVYNLMLDSSKMFYLFILNEIKNKSIENFLTFNGRLSCSRPILVASKKQKISYWVYDGFYNGKFPILAKNEMFHSLEFVRNNSIKSYLKDINNSNLIAKDHILKKTKSIRTFEKSFTNHQTKNYLDPKINLNKKIISIFTSSDDEYRFLGEDWSEYKIPIQYNEIHKLNKYIDKNEFQIVVKMHPNQKYINKNELDNYKYLQKEMLILPPDNKTDTYELILRSEYVINFCSSVGAEANYLRKKVIQIGPSMYIKLPIANYVKDAKECYKLIKNSSVKIMPLRASIIWFNYLYSGNINLDMYSIPSPGIFLYHNKQLKVKLSTKIISSIDKLITQLVKGDFSIFENFTLYITNFIFSKNNVK